MKLYNITCTFAHLGTKNEVKKSLKNNIDKNIKIIFEESEFVGTKEEVHHGIFKDKFGVYNGENIKDVTRDYIYHKDINGECFTVSLNGKDILTEEDIYNKKVGNQNE